MGTAVTLQQLEYVVAVADQRHFGRAAEACFVSQPGLSAQIREVERRLGVVLFERTPRGVLVTGAGDEVVRRARSLLRDADDLVDAARSDGGTVAGPLALGVIPTLAPYVLSKVVATTTNRFPEAQLNLQDVRTVDLTARLVDGALDLGILATEVESPALDSFELGDDPFVVVVGEHHPLARQRGALGWADLRAQRVMLLEDGHCLRLQTSAACAIGELEVHDVHATSLTAITQMVAAGVGITLLPTSAAALEARPGSGVVVRRLRAPVPSRRVRLAWRHSSPRAGAYRELARLLRPALGLRRITADESGRSTTPG